MVSEEVDLASLGEVFVLEAVISFEVDYMIMRHERSGENQLGLSTVGWDGMGWSLMALGLCGTH